MNLRYSSLIGFCFLLGTGCSAGGLGQSLGLFPERQTLLQVAKESRQIPTNVPKELSKTVLDAYIVEPGDGLLILPADLDSPVRLPSDQTVLPDGTIDLGKYGKLLVAGKSVTEIEELVNATVKKTTADAGFIDVRLVNRQSKMFYVLGEVQTPGKFPLTGNETALDAILTAGGLTDKASRSQIILVRPNADGCGTIYAVLYSQIVQLGDLTTNYQILPGDRIFVPTKGFLESFNEHLHHDSK